MLLHNRIPVSRRFASRPLPPPPSPSSTSQPHQQPSTVGLTVLCVLGGAFVAVSTPSLTLLFQILASTCLFSSSLLPCPQPGVASSSSGQQQSRFYTGIIVQPSITSESQSISHCDRHCRRFWHNHRNIVPWSTALPKAFPAPPGQEPIPILDNERFKPLVLRSTARAPCIVDISRHSAKSPASAPVSNTGGTQNGKPGHHPSIAMPKNVAFELLFDGPNTRARLPMRVQIFPHDTTDSIVTTVKNFYGLYDGATTGVSFEDERGITLIARYENLRNNMIVYVRVIPDYLQTAFQQGRPWNQQNSMSPQGAPHLDEAFQMRPPAQLAHHNFHEPFSRPSSRIARKRSASPRLSRSRRSVSAQKHQTRSGIKSRDTSLPPTVEEPYIDALNCCSDSDGGAASVTSSLKARSEQLASAEISVDNIVEGGRRKRAKFESSELPLFVPPQVPAAYSISSISPQRRSNGQDNASPFARPPRRQYINQQPLPSPQNYGHNEYSHGIVTNNPSYAVPLPASHGHRLRDRPNIARPVGQGITPVISRPQTFGILPTPDPTVASCISDEDVALQLMRLGDASNISHGRTSASTADDALSGRAEIASSASSDGDDESEDAGSSSSRLPYADSGRGSMTESAAYLAKGQDYEDNNGGHPFFDHTQQHDKELDHAHQYEGRKDKLFENDADDIVNEYALGSKTGHVRINPLSRKGSKHGKQRSATGHKKSKVPSVAAGSKIPLSPASVAPHSRKTSSASTLNFQHHLGVDEEDLSSKPRCQRCRKSKKGCDRQRPCQRCKDAGIGIEGCVSEDEGNGRKGRFGRHMGVSVKKDMPAETASEVLGTITTETTTSLDKSKKRKR